MSWQTLVYCGRRTHTTSDGTEYWSCWGESYTITEGPDGSLVVTCLSDSWRSNPENP